MDNTEKRNISLRLSRCRAGLLRKYPFFGNMVMHLSFGLDEGCGTAYTDMKHIVFDPEFAGRLSDEELEFVLMHEVMHCVLNHPARGKDKMQFIYNVACDIVVNSNIIDYMGVHEFKVDGEYAMHRTPSGKEGKNYTAEEVYNELLMKQNAAAKMSDTDSDLIFDDAAGNDFYSCIGEMKTVDSHDIWTEIETDSQDSDMWEKRIDDYGSKYGFDTNRFPQSVRKIFEDSEKQANIKWKDYLRDFMTAYVDITDYSFAPPDRRFSDSEFMLPGENTFFERNGLQDIYFFVDTSASVSPKELTRLCGEVKHVVEECLGVSGYISFFDTSVTEPVPFSYTEDFDDIVPTGGGGTDFRIIFEYMEEHATDVLPCAIIIMTDGYAEDVPEEIAKGIPVLWVLINNKKDKPWGENIHIYTE